MSIKSSHRHDAIYELYPNVKGITMKGDTWILLDSDENEVTVDRDAVETKASEVLSAEQLSDLRKERNKLLTETDHWAYQDAPDMTQDKIDYRQALRDITDTYTSLDDVVWPTKP